MLCFERKPLLSRVLVGKLQIGQIQSLPEDESFFRPAEDSLFHPLLLSILLDNTFRNEQG